MRPPKLMVTFFVCLCCTPPQTMYRRLIDAQQSKSRVDPEVTLQFLKSAVYYFLTDKENNTRGHLNAIESILGFSDAERRRIEQARGGPTK